MSLITLTIVDDEKNERCKVTYNKETLVLGYEAIAKMLTSEQCAALKLGQTEFEVDTVFGNYFTKY